MDIFKKVSEGAKTITEGARTLGKRSGDLVSVARLKYELSKLEKELENNFLALGNLVYMKHRGEEGLEEDYGRLLKSIETLESDIADFNVQIVKLNPRPVACPNCQTELPHAAKFCLNCGTRVKEDVQEEE